MQNGKSYSINYYRIYSKLHTFISSFGHTQSRHSNTHQRPVNELCGFFCVCCVWKSAEERISTQFTRMGQIDVRRQSDKFQLRKIISLFLSFRCFFFFVLFDFLKNFLFRRERPISRDVTFVCFVCDSVIFRFVVDSIRNT